MGASPAHVDVLRFLKLLLAKHNRGKCILLSSRHNTHDNTCADVDRKNWSECTRRGIYNISFMSGAGSRSDLRHPAQFGKRGGLFEDTLTDDIGNSALALDTADISTSTTTTSSPRHVRFPPGYLDQSSGSSSAVHSLTSASTLSTLESKLDLSPTNTAAGKAVLRDSVFTEWKDDATDLEAENAEDLQKKDPIGTQVWKLYHKQKGQLPNSERLENLTWRMMSMNLRRKELERQG